jgi:PKHD-type hydroxylase
VLIHIPKLLDPEQVGRVARMLGGARFADGRLSAGMAARRVKHNEEVTGDEARVRELNNLVMGPLVQHPVYRYAVLPRRVAVPFYARYRKGMGYGDHVDDPVMGAGDRYRSDVSITVFLNAPEAYEGGELVIATSFGEQTVKYPAGDAVLYPSSSRHRVAPVGRGERLVAVTWAQSLVRSPERRELLYDLYQARQTLLRETPNAGETRQVDKAYVNLLRMWAEL